MSLAVVKDPWAQTQSTAPVSLDQFGDVLTPREAAKVLQCSDKHVRALCREGAIPCFKVGRLTRIPKAQFLRWINEG